MKKRKSLIAAAAAVFLLAGVLLLWSAQRQRPPVREKNAANFAVLLTDLVNAYEGPSDGDEAVIDADLAAIRSVSRRDAVLANSIAEQWRGAFLDPSYRLYLYPGDEAASLADVGVQNSSSHAIVVLGYELEDGQMQPELIGRCETAAALAEAFPEAILVCSGGATGENNADGHTEAGLMKAWLSGPGGVEESRIFIDEAAMTTQENAVNTFKILQTENVKTMTIVTSSYHQRWGQAVYNAVGALYRQRYGYSVEIRGNYCYDTEPTVEMYKAGDRIAAFQIAGILELPEDAIRTLPSFFPSRPQNDASEPAA